MKKLLLLFLFLSVSLIAQDFQLNLDSYKTFLGVNKNLNASGIMQLHNAGTFSKDINNDWRSAEYIDSIEIKLGLTADEKFLLEKNGFVVTERLNKFSLGSALIDIYNNDLPVFITSDAILHAFHYSYDKILKDIELNYLIDKVKNLIQKLYSSLPAFANQYQAAGDFDKYFKDVDVYLTIPLKFFDSSIQPNYIENTNIVDNLYNSALSEKPGTLNLFSSVGRNIDFSQFKPRGHYDDDIRPQLKNYFRAMVWFGKIELYFIAPQSLYAPTFEDVKRQGIISYLVSELIKFNNAEQDYKNIEDVINSFVGDQDNITLENLSDLKTKTGFSSAMALTDSSVFKTLQDTLSLQPYADQKILSQVLIKDPFNPSQLEPASAFMLFGQRFVIDSYVTGNVVYDKTTSKRMLPSTLDILFALGNNAALQLLSNEIEQYNYAPNLAALRYVIDSYTDDFWESSIYNNWLSSISSLNPPLNREHLPKFMQSAAWWQEKMNTQLAFWTELRHDNLLYAKQSYSAGIGCSYPYAYVEPIPEFYKSVKILTESFNLKLQNLSINNIELLNSIRSYVSHFTGVCDTLASIANKESNVIPFTESENNFLKSILNSEEICGVIYTGWYPKLYYAGSIDEEISSNPMVVADYHTAPTDEFGNAVGWVAHAGTGPVNMAIITASLPSGNNVAFIGPVMSYYEYTSTNFLRLTDEEWKNVYFSQSLRPDWSSIFLADKNGNLMVGGSSLVTSINDKKPVQNLPENYLIAQNYPNPFNPSTIIVYSIPADLAFSNVKLIIYNIQGQEINTLLDKELPAGKYMTKWDGKNNSGVSVASGIYFYSLKAGDRQFTGKMNLIK